MDEVREMKLMIAASLLSAPATEEDLRKRDFLKSKSIFGTARLIQQMLADGWIYETNDDVLHCYKKTERMLNFNGY